MDNVWLKVALILAVIGAINWGLIGFFRFDLIAALFGGMATVTSRIIYGIIGVGGLLSLMVLFRPVERVEDNRHYQPS